MNFGDNYIRRNKTLPSCFGPKGGVVCGKPLENRINGSVSIGGNKNDSTRLKSAKTL